MNTSRRIYAFAFIAALCIALGDFSRVDARPSQAQTDVSRDGFDVEWDPNTFYETGIGAASAATLRDFYRWRPGVTRDEFEKAIESSSVELREDSRAQLMQLWDGHYQRMRAAYAAGGSSLWQHAQKMAEIESSDRFSKALAAMSVAQADRFSKLQSAAIEDTHWLFSEVAERLSAERAADVALAEARLIDRMLRGSSDIPGDAGVGGTQVDIASFLPTSEYQGNVRARELLLAWYNGAEPLRVSILRASAQVARMAYFLRSPDQTFADSIRQRMDQPSLRADYVALYSLLRATLAELDEALGVLPQASLLTAHDRVAFPKSFPDRMRGIELCAIAVELAESNSNTAAPVKAIVDSKCAEIYAVCHQLRQLELQLQLLLSTSGDGEAIERLDVENSRATLVASRDAMAVELRKSLDAVAGSQQIDELLRGSTR